MAPTHPTSFQRYQPTALLSTVVESLWLQQCPWTGSSAGQVIVPAVRCELIFNFADPFVHSSPTFERVPLASIQGLRTVPIVAAPTGRTGLLIVNLQPWALGVLCGIDGKDAKNLSIDLNEVWPAHCVERLLHDLRKPQENFSRIKLISDFLAQKLGSWRHELRTARAVTQLSQGQALRDVAQQLGVGRRQLRRIVRTSTGIAPKQLANLVRCQHALNQLRCPKPLAEVSHANGYVDQSHMHKELKRFTGLTPKALRQRQTCSELAVFNRPSENALFGVTYL